jgi:hypothetical protein
MARGKLSERWKNTDGTAMPMVLFRSVIVWIHRNTGYPIASEENSWSSDGTVFEALKR